MDISEPQSVFETIAIAEDTPPVIDYAVQAFVASLPTVSPAVYVDVRPIREGERSNCFGNVDVHIVSNGGTAVNGWAIWHWPGVLLHAERHACWRDPRSRTLIDLTPKPQGRILFVPDLKDQPVPWRTPSIYKALNSDPLVARWIELINEIHVEIGDGETIQMSSRIPLLINEGKIVATKLLAKYPHRT